MKKNIFKNMDKGIFLCSIILCIIGMVALFSATQEAGTDALQKQIIWFAISMPIVAIIIFIDYETISKIAPVLYRHIYCITNSSIFYRTSIWSYKLV